MQTVNERLRTFIKTGPLRWPHPDSFIATPKALAEAGFYHDPSEDDPDNVICFMCSKELGGWDGDDDPYRVHISKSPKCPWALTRCAVESDFDSHGKFRPSSPSRYPDNKTLEKARLDTFGGRKKWWMHDKTKNHGANSKKMSKAGFIYTPQTPGDDTATCYYCDLSLSGWDEEDDPLEEHKRRESRSGKPCPFFSHDPQSDSTKSTTKSTNTEKPSIPAKDQDPEPDRAPTRKSVRKPKASHAKQAHASVSVPDLAPEPKPAPSKKSKKSTAPKASRPKAVQVQEPIQEIQHEEVVKPREEPERIKSLEPEQPEPEPPASEQEVEPTQPEQHLEEPEPEPEPEVEPEPNPNPDPDPDSILIPANDAASPSLLTSDPIGFLPPLATSPIKLIRHLTEEERAMTVEQWIRHEMEVQYQTLKRDGERRIQAFKRHAAEVRTQIEAL